MTQKKINSRKKMGIADMLLFEEFYKRLELVKKNKISKQCFIRFFNFAGTSQLII